MVHFVDGSIAQDTPNMHPVTAAPVGLSAAQTT
jgi:hypothetical protein